MQWSAVRRFIHAESAQSISAVALLATSECFVEPNADTVIYSVHVIHDETFSSFTRAALIAQASAYVGKTHREWLEGWRLVDLRIERSLARELQACVSAIAGVEITRELPMRLPSPHEFQIREEGGAVKVYVRERQP